MPLDPADTAPGPHRPTATEIRRRLTHERDSRLAQLKAMEESGAFGAGGDGTDPFLAAQRASVDRVLTDIDIAFDHLEQGRYGNCEGCTRPIPEERLEILPYARRCVGCRQRVPGGSGAIGESGAIGGSGP
ncbi:TraR/DksA family transcriptional regulator [Streptomyces sp. NPDC091292]|uniref:TraR/DksA family transcriptional regulator n=1 Tax=Streptomyces sp. NPDC091292 TaxID=3365991 RepID=UPI00382200F4